MQRRDLLRGSLLLAGVPPLCCTTPLASRASVTFQGSTVVLDLNGIADLQAVGGAVAVVDEARGLNILVAHTDNGCYAALDRTCTHGGAQCTYNHKRKSLRCTSLNHAEYDLNGTLLHGRTHGNLRAYPARLTGTRLVISLETVA